MTYLLKKDGPIIVAHRGLSSIYPENTLEGFRAALDCGADFIELDVVLDKNREPIVCHDAFLSKVSDVAKYPEFADRKCKRILDGEEKDDWWIIDFSTEELKTLTLRQCILKRSDVHDWKYQIPTLKEVINYAIEYNSQQQIKKGMLIEIKDHEFHITYAKTQITERICELLTQLKLNTITEAKDVLPIALMSFDVEAVKQIQVFSGLPSTQLIWSEAKVQLQLTDIIKYTNMIGIEINMIWSRETQSNTPLYHQAKELGLIIYSWTFQDDNPEIHTLFASDDPKYIYKCANNLNGIITEFPNSMI